MARRIQPLDFKYIQSVESVEYKDSDIAFTSDMSNLPVGDTSLQLEMFVIIACKKGRLQVAVNGTLYTLEQNHIIVSRPKSLIENLMLSPDFDGGIVALSDRIIVESFSDSDFWDRGLYLSDTTVIKANPSELHIMMLIGELLKAKADSSQRIYRKEILHSIVKAAIYEILTNVPSQTITKGKNLMHQRDVLFKKFIKLMTSLRVKPRNVSWYAQRLNVTPKYLASVCKTLSGKSAFDWINHYVRSDIDNLLKNSDKSVKEIALALEFPTISFFGKYVRAYSGMSPTEYRKKLREKGQ